MIFFTKFIRKYLSRSLFLIKLQVIILQLHWQKGLGHWGFLMNFVRYLGQNTPGDCFFTTEKYFTNKIVKNSLGKEKKWKQFVRKTMTRAEQKLNHNIYQIFISFYYSKISLFLFFLLPMILEREFLETMQSH